MQKEGKEKCRVNTPSVSANSRGTLYSPFTSFLLSFEPPPAPHFLLGCHPASRHIHLMVQCLGSSDEHAVLHPALDLLPGAAATCPAVQCLALISLRQEPSGQLHVPPFHQFTSKFGRIHHWCTVEKKKKKEKERCCHQETDVQTKGNRHPAITHEDVLSHSI